MSERDIYYGVLGVSMALTASNLAASNAEAQVKEAEKPAHEFSMEMPRRAPEVQLGAGRIAVIGSTIADLERFQASNPIPTKPEVPFADLVAQADTLAVNMVLESLPKPEIDLSFLNKSKTDRQVEAKSAPVAVQYERVNAEGIPESVLCSRKNQWKNINTANAAIGRQVAEENGWVGAEFEALLELNACESSWDETAENPTSHAGGIPQALPKSKMASEGDDWETNPWTQLRWQAIYIIRRYGSPSAALAFFKLNNSY